MTGIPHREASHSSIQTVLTETVGLTGGSLSRPARLTADGRGSGSLNPFGTTSRPQLRIAGKNPGRQQGGWDIRLTCPEVLRCPDSVKPDDRLVQDLTPESLPEKTCWLVPGTRG